MFGAEGVTPDDGGSRKGDHARKRWGHRQFAVAIVRQGFGAFYKKGAPRNNTPTTAHLLDVSRAHPQVWVMVDEIYAQSP